MIGRTYNIRGVTLYGKFGKRLFDVLFSASLLIVLSPVILIIALIVYVKMGRPILFSQERPGLNEKIFTMYKFRTMTDERDEEGNLLPDGDRLTKFGKLLRSTSLDELPELFNIIKGDMAIVGPRPLLVQYLPIDSFSLLRIYLLEEKLKIHQYWILVVYNHFHLLKM